MSNSLEERRLWKATFVEGCGLFLRSTWQEGARNGRED